MTDAEARATIAKAFVLEMHSRGVEKITDPAVEYHLALLLRPEGHPAIRTLDSVSTSQGGTNAESGNDMGASSDDRDRALHVRPSTEHALSDESEQPVCRLPVQEARGTNTTPDRTEVEDVSGLRSSNALPLTSGPILPTWGCPRRGSEGRLQARFWMGLLELHQSTLK